MGEGKGQGNCVKAVAYMIKTLITEAEKREKWYPYQGYVYLSSSNACAALMCYFKAFMLNGYEYDEKELNNFISTVKGKGNTARFVFKKFINKELKEKGNTMKRQEEASVKFMSINLNNLKF